ncbi:MAG: hypothetical protein WC209_07550 [Ignavibacteriaceae bacterium]|jgi:DNA mismatch repair ATPase MutS
MKNQINYLRSIWGKPLAKHRNFDLISSYHKLLYPKGGEPIVDEKTWNDLDFNSIFASMDRNLTGIGQQYLYHLLHKYEKDETFLKKRFELTATLKENQQLREKIQLNLFGLSGVSSYFVAYLVLNKSIPTTKFFPFFIVSSLLTVLSILLIPVNGILLFVALILLIINLLINKIFSKQIYEYFTGFSSLNSLIAAALSIGRIKTDVPIAEIEFLKNKKNVLTSLKKKLGYLVIDKEHLNELAVVAIEYLNMFLLFDIIAYYRSANTLREYQNDIRLVFETVANLDVSISVASYLEEKTLYSSPIFNNSGEISFRDLYHPLIDNAIPNSVDNIASSILITGSNMSGKTTFIKTIGINFILSQTFYFSLSDEFNIPNYFIKSAIRRNEDLEEGKSYFFVEIETLLEFIKLSQEKEKYLFLVDEIFRGTNTIERLASSTAVLKFLDSNSRVFVTTHDIELQDLLENNFKMYHFSEQVEKGKFFFNYKIKEGPCSSGNAIKLLEIMHYPTSITDEANLLAQELLKNNSFVTRINKLNC